MTVAIREAVVVEGKYDAIRLHSVVDATIVETDGFGIFRQPEKMELLRKLAHAQGLIVLTDSDSAGFVIRDRISGSLPTAQVKHAYIPEITGKERRKEKPSKEGLLGVEGVDGKTVLAALFRAGATPLEGVIDSPVVPYLTKQRLYEDGLSGREDSAKRRAAFLKRLQLPQHLSANRLVEVLNALLTEQEYEEMLENA